MRTSTGAATRSVRNAAAAKPISRAAVSASLAFNLPPIYSLLLGLMLVVAFYALLNWRDYAERQRLIAQLRPFVASQQLYEQLVAAPANIRQPADIQAPFEALCRELLQARVAYLLPLGPLAPLFGAPLAHPRHAHVPDVIPETLSVMVRKPQNLFVPLERGIYDEAAWAISLWSERGLNGLLLLGEKIDGSLYTQEEFEIARVTA